MLTVGQQQFDWRRLEQYALEKQQARQTQDLGEALVEPRAPDDSGDIPVSADELRVPAHARRRHSRKGVVQRGKKKVHSNEVTLTLTHN